MSTSYPEATKETISHTCTICGANMYVTDHGNHELILHCSSDAARFWDFDRGSAEQRVAKEHWDNSRLEIF